jgi:hypothetical protein
MMRGGAAGGTHHFPGRVVRDLVGRALGQCLSANHRRRGLLGHRRHWPGRVHHGHKGLARN